MFCPNCGKPVGETDRFCPNCGVACAAPTQEPVQPDYQPAPQQSFQQTQPQQPYAQQPYAQQSYVQQPYAQPVTARKRSGKKGVLIGVGCVALAALVGGGAWFLMRRKQSDNQLLRAADRSLSELKAYTESLPNLHAIMENTDQILAGEAFHLGLERMNSYSYTYNGQTESGEAGIRLAIDLDQKDKRGQVTGTYATGEMDIPFSLYLDETQLQATSSALLEEGEALSLPLKDFAKQWNASALAKLADRQIPENLDTISLREDGVEEALKASYGDDWSKFCDSFETVRFDGTPHFGTEGVTYTLTWDRDALKRMYEKTDLDTVMSDFEDLDDFARLNLNEFYAKTVIAGLGEMNEKIKEQEFYVVDGKLVGIWLVVDNDGEAGNLELRLCGEQNPWEHITCKTETQYSSYTTTDIADITLKKSDDQLRLTLTSKHTDSDGEDYGYEDGPYTLVYQDSDGAITYEEDGERQEGPALHLVPVEDGFRFSVEETDGDSEDYKMQTSTQFTIAGKIGAIAPLSTKPIEILKLTEQELQDLVQRIQEKAQTLE